MQIKQFIGGLAEGQQLPPFTVQVTRTLIVAGAIASRDAQDVHHDPVATQQRGFKDIFMNNFTTMALVTRYLNDWAGPEAVVTGFIFKLGRPQYPDDDLRFTGVVKSVAPQGGRMTHVTVDVTGTNSLGTHITSTIRLAIGA